MAARSLSRSAPLRRVVLLFKPEHRVARGNGTTNATFCQLLTRVIGRAETAAKAMQVTVVIKTMPRLGAVTVTTTASVLKQLAKAAEVELVQAEAAMR